MPRSGESNKLFGIYESVCCGAEIVIPESVTFPQCLKHNKTLTEWRNVADKNRSASAGQAGREKDDSAA
jgi:hypothetical protein